MRSELTVRSLRVLLPLLTLAATISGAGAATTVPAGTPVVERTPAEADSFLWLEDVTGTRALDWVAKHDARSRQVLAEDSAFKVMDTGFLKILDSKEKIPTVQK